MKTAHFLTLAFATIPLAALADTPATSPYAGNTTTVHDIDTYHDEAAVLEQKVLIQQLQAKLSGASGAEPDPAPSSPNGFSPPLQPVAPPSSAPALPEVVSIESVPGSGRKLTATLQMPSGAQISAYPGLGLPGGLTVYDITYNGVRVMDAGQLEVLPTVTDMSSEDAEAPSQPNVMMPPAMSMPRLPMSLPGSP